MGDMVAEWLARWISRSRHLCLRRGWVNVLCSWAKHFTLTVPLSLPPPPPPRSMNAYQCELSEKANKILVGWVGWVGKGRE